MAVKKRSSSTAATWTPQLNSEVTESPSKTFTWSNLPASDGYDNNVISTESYASPTVEFTLLVGPALSTAFEGLVGFDENPTTSTATATHSVQAYFNGASGNVTLYLGSAAQSVVSTFTANDKFRFRRSGGNFILDKWVTGAWTQQGMVAYAPSGNLQLVITGTHDNKISVEGLA